MTSICTRCGQVGHIEYGADGLAYCNACIFYGLNRPCWKCRMYLPASELQQYRGQLTCQYCIMDLRDEERRMEERGKEREKGERKLEEEQYRERCERCGKVLEVAYFYHNKRLCSSCTEREKGEWEGKGSEGPPVVAYRIKKEKGMVSSIVEAVEKKIGDVISDRKQPDKGKKDEKNAEKLDKESAEKKPMTEELAKTSGIKYELADYKDIKIDDDEKLKSKPEEKTDERKEKTKKHKKAHPEKKKKDG